MTRCCHCTQTCPPVSCCPQISSTPCYHSCGETCRSCRTCSYSLSQVCHPCSIQSRPKRKEKITAFFDSVPSLSRSRKRTQEKPNSPKKKREKKSKKKKEPEEKKKENKEEPKKKVDAQTQLSGPAKNQSSKLESTISKTSKPETVDSQMSRPGLVDAIPSKSNASELKSASVSPSGKIGQPDKPSTPPKPPAPKPKKDKAVEVKAKKQTKAVETSQKPVKTQTSSTHETVMEGTRGNDALSQGTQDVAAATENATKAVSVDNMVSLKDASTVAKTRRKCCPCCRPRSVSQPARRDQSVDTTKKLCQGCKEALLANKGKTCVEQCVGPCKGVKDINRKMGVGDEDFRSRTRQVPCPCENNDRQRKIGPCKTYGSFGDEYFRSRTRKVPCPCENNVRRVKFEACTTHVSLADTCTSPRCRFSSDRSQCRCSLSRNENSNSKGNLKSQSWAVSQMAETHGRISCGKGMGSDGTPRKPCKKKLCPIKTKMNESSQTEGQNYRGRSSRPQAAKCGACCKCGRSGCGSRDVSNLLPISCCLKSPVRCQ